MLSWTKYLSSFGIYPIIVTRNWNDEQTDITGKVENNETRVEKFEGYEVHRVKYPYTLRDRCSKYTITKPIQKALTLYELIFSNYFLGAISYSNLYNYCDELLTDDKEIKCVMASARPFQSFAIGHRLKKKFDIKWIPDYRDEWSTRASNIPTSRMGKFLHNLEKKSELKWTSNADAFITVSDHWRDNIATYNGREGFVVKNGFDASNNDLIQNSKGTKSANEIKIIYVGTLYPYQPIEQFIAAAMELKKKNTIQFSVTFIGTSPTENCDPRLQNLIADHKDLFTTMGRMKKDELLKLLPSYDLALATNYINLKGCIPVKLYDYFMFDLPTLLFPSDDDLMANFISSTNSGYVVNDSLEFDTLMSKLELEKRENNRITTNRNIEEGMKYSRKNQANILSNVLKKFID